MNRELSLHMRSLARLDHVALKNLKVIHKLQVQLTVQYQITNNVCCCYKKKPVLSNEKTTVTTTSRNTHCNRLQPRAVRSCSLNLQSKLTCLQTGQCGGLESDSKVSLCMYSETRSGEIVSEIQLPPLGGVQSGCTSRVSGTALVGSSGKQLNKFHMQTCVRLWFP